MYKVLAIETSGKHFSLACAESGDSGCGIRAEIFFDIGLRHSEILKPSCEFILNTCAWQKSDLTALAVTTGPGSFTGIRVGVAFARALAQALQLPLVGVPAFDVIARGLPDLSAPKWVLIDSIGEELFLGKFSSGGKAYDVASLSEVCAQIKRAKKMVLAGPGFLKYQQKLQSVAGKKNFALAEEQHFPRARCLADCAADELGKPQKHDWQDVAPFYLRPPIALERAKIYRKKL